MADVLSEKTLKGLCDKLYDKRKNAAIEIQRVVESIMVKGELDKVEKLAMSLQSDFVQSQNPNSRKGGLIGLAATAIGLGANDVHRVLPLLVPPVLPCLTDGDHRVRYYACEALYNISKVAFSDMLGYFNEIFIGLCELYPESGVADPNAPKDGAAGTRAGADMLDRLLKDIVIDQNCLPNLEQFIQNLRERIHTYNPQMRQFLVSWISVLSSVPGIDLLKYLPNILEGLFKILCDDNFEIRRSCEDVLDVFLTEMTQVNHEELDYEMDYSAMVDILLPFCETSKHNLCRFMSVRWLRTFISLAKEDMLPFAPDIVQAILPCLSMSVDTKLRTLADLTNGDLMVLIAETNLDQEAQEGKEEEENAGRAFNYPQVLKVLTAQLGNDSVATRVATLSWFSMLRSKMPKQTFHHVQKFSPALLKSLSDGADKVVRMDLQVLADLSTCGESAGEDEARQVAGFFDSFVKDLLQLFCRDQELLVYRGSFIIRHLSKYIDAEKLYLALADNLLQEDDLDFANRMVETLNMILLTSPEFVGLREELKQMSSESSHSLFCALYRTWSHNPIATFSLCLLTQVYQHACELLVKLADMEVTVNFLVEVDKLIQLIESPIFTFLRLHLLEPRRHPYLIKALYGILMLLPQSSAFHTLKNRLDCIPTIINSLQDIDNPPKEKNVEARTRINFENLSQHFDEVHALHVEAISRGSRSRRDILNSTPS
eukprot:m.84543 g.84543  ORF g.84543 m.84543 type:complete len:714 (-) comp12972_c0_seq1:1852-3993(-)